MVAVNNALALPYLDFRDLGKDHSDISAQWNEVSRDGIISIDEIKRYPALATHIVGTLGYGSIEAFLAPHGENVYGNISLTKKSQIAITASISGFVSGGVQYTESKTNQLPMNVDPESTFVVFTLNNGNKITFDGPGAGKVANEFAKIYNNSPTFRQTIVTLAGEQGGQYSFHSVPLPADNYSQVLGFNFAGTDKGFRASGVFIQSNPSFTFNLAATIIHEVAHDLHPDSHSNHGHEDEGLFDVGKSHSREQSLFHSIIVNEVEANGVSLGYDVNGDDYSHDVTVFDDDYAHGGQTNGTVSTTDMVTLKDGTTVNALSHYSAQYQKAKEYIANGEYDKAIAILNGIPADAQITLNFQDPQRKGTITSETYNVRELFLQDLMFAADSKHRFNTGMDDSKFRQNFANFLNRLVNTDSQGIWADAIDSAAAGIGFNLAVEFPTYSGGTGVTGTDKYRDVDVLDILRRRILLDGLESLRSSDK